MPVNLLGLMAIAMFYVITVVVGLCANRCLSREIDDDDDVIDEGDTAPQPASTNFRDAKESQIELLEIVEACQSSLTPSSSAGHPQIFSARAENAAFAARSKEPVMQIIPDGGVHAGTPDSLDSEPTYSGDKWETRNSVPHNPPHYEGGMWQRIGPRLSGAVVDGAESEYDYYDYWSGQSETAKNFPPGGKYLLAEKNVGVILGSLSILAIKTGGVFSNSIAQEVHEQGLLWCQVPVASSLSLIIGGALFARNLYSEGYVTLLDPFQEIYGVRVGAIQFIPILISDLLFSAVILSSLGALLHITLGFSQTFGIVISLVSMLLYLIVGGLYAGTFTDAAQFIYLCLGCWLLLPFVMTNQPTKSVSSTFPGWLGKVDGRHSGLYIDQMAVLVLGGIPMQSYFQRVLSSKSTKGYRIITLVGSVGCLVNSVPAVLIGAAAASTEWSNTSFAQPVIGENTTTVLPICLAHLVPHAIMFLSLGALACGLLASCDSTIFGLATILSHNIYRNWLRPQATDKELIWLARLAVVVVSLLTLLLCLVWPRWHHYWILPYDLLYVLVFPQLFCVVYFKYSNTYGAIAGLIVGTTLRILFGEAKINFVAILPLPFWHVSDGQLFPYRTLAMLGNLLSVIFVSVLYDYLYNKGTVSSTKNIFLCFDTAHSDTRSRTSSKPQENVKAKNRRLQDIRYLSGQMKLEATVERMTVV